MLDTIDLPPAARSWPLPRGKSIFLQENDARILLYLASRTQDAIVEIGCNVGHTTRDLALAFPKRRVIGVDYSGATAMHEGQRTEQPDREKIGHAASSLPNVTILDVDSRTLDYSALAPVGLVFIDGDHTLEGVRADTELALSLSPRPVIAWHDVSEGHPDWVGVLRYLTELAKTHDIVRVRDTWVAYLAP